jgi:hydroxymethylpyrimidine pyrophosphatase-like HAD family hydrolase
LNPERLLIIADGENDVDLFHLPGLKVAVANAYPGLKKLADYVTERPSSRGVKEIIDLVEAD